MEERKALIMKKEEGGDTMMDLWRTGRDRLKERVELLGSHFKELRGLFFLASCGAISYFFSAAVSEEITEMESQREALYGSNRDQNHWFKPAQLCNSPPHTAPPFAFTTSTNLGTGSGWVSFLSLNLLPAYHPLKSNSSEWQL